jgi:formylglycine-generating enzyme required for sulfatase activity
MAHDRRGGNALRRLAPRACALALLSALCCAVPRLGAQSAVDTVFVQIHAAGDSFTMGDGVLGPNVSQTLARDFFVSKFPITNAQFGRFIEEGGYEERSYWTANGWTWKGRLTQPAFWKDAKFNGPDQPVVGVSWYEAVAYCNWLSLQDGLRPAYDDTGRARLEASGYRLPTELEWEYAAAKGAPDQEERIYPWGDSWDPKNLVSGMAQPKATRTAAVGSRSPLGDTPQGLADMSGNVWEWCSDNTQSDGEITESPHPDRYYFQGDSSFQYMELRGGSWCNTFQNGFRSAFRGFSAPPGSRYNVSGFRIVRSAPLVPGG